MRVVANGKARDVGAGTTLPAFLESLGLHADNVAVEHNGEALARSEFGAVVLADGDRLEIVKAVAGGSGRAWPPGSPASVVRARR